MCSSSCVCVLQPVANTNGFITHLKSPQEARNLSSETFSKFIQDINRRVEALLKKE